MTWATGDRVIISNNPVDASDRYYSGKVGTVESYTHTNGNREVYDVLLDNDDYSHAFYDSDLIPFGELETLRAELAQAEAKVVKLKEAIKRKERDGSILPIGTVITAKGDYGPSVITKQAEGVWLNIFTGPEGEPRSASMDDERVTDYLAHDGSAVIRKP